MLSLTPKDYSDAIMAQSAVNLSGLVHSLSNVVSRIWDEPECSGTQYVNTHPIVVLYAAQIAYLSGLGVGNGSEYSEAYAECERRTKGD
jgi:hypothetical protein